MDETKDVVIPELMLNTPEEKPLPELTLANDLDVTLPEMPVVSIEKVAEALPERNLAQDLTPEELRAVNEFAQKIDLNNSTQVLQYGAGAQQKMSAFSEAALENVRAKDMGDVGSMVSNLVVELKGFSPDEEKGGFLGFFKKKGNQLDKMVARYDTVEKNVDNIAHQLEQHKMVLIKDVAMLDKMYDRNLEYYKELTMYVIAGRKKLKEVEDTDLVAMQKRAKETGKPEDAQTANDLANMCNRFDKKLYDLELTRNICIQMGPQIRLIQTNDTMMAEKIQSSIVNTIPLWKNQMVLTLGLAHSKDAIEAQRKVTDMTNELLTKNADTLKTSTIEAARESERGIIDIETLKHTNQALISTLDEVMVIQREGRENRRLAEGELQRIENELKVKLLQVGDEVQAEKQVTGK